MSSGRDYYEALGVPRDADAETIKTAFRQLAHRYHPDVSKEPDAEQRFREIAEAYGVLSDPAKRADYDAQGSASLPGATAEDLWSRIDLADVFGAGAAEFGTLFGRLFGPAAAARAGEDVLTELTIPLEEILTGGEHTVTISRPAACPRCGGRGSRAGTASRRCPRCGGSGQCVVSDRQGSLLVREVMTCPGCAGQGWVIGDPCAYCGATGRVTRDESLTIRVPPGIGEGAAVRLFGRGMPGPVPGARAGDVYVRIHTRADPRFRRVGADLWHDLHVQAADAALGGSAEVPVPEGHVRVRIPPGTQPGTVLRVAGKGLPRYGASGRGSLHLTVVVDIPRQLSQPQRQLYEQLRATDVRRTMGGTRTPAPDQVLPTEHGAPTDQGEFAESGARAATSRGPLLVSMIILSITAVAVLVGGFVIIGASSLLDAWGSVMIMSGIAQLLAVVGVWVGSRTRLRSSRSELLR